MVVFLQIVKAAVFAQTFDYGGGKTCSFFQVVNGGEFAVLARLNDVARRHGADAGQCRKRRQERFFMQDEFIGA